MCGRAAEGPHRRWRDGEIDLGGEEMKMSWWSGTVSKGDSTKKNIAIVLQQG